MRADQTKRERIRWFGSCAILKHDTCILRATNCKYFICNESRKYDLWIVSFSPCPHANSIHQSWFVWKWLHLVSLLKKNAFIFWYFYERKNKTSFDKQYYTSHYTLNFQFQARKILYLHILISEGLSQSCLYGNHNWYDGDKIRIF